MECNRISIMNFTGIRPRRRSGKFIILPITQNTNLNRIKKYVEFIDESNEIGNGYNGLVYRINDKLVIKTNRPFPNLKTRAFEEGEKLDMLYELGKERPVDLQNTQKGIIAFKDDSRSYLVSSYVVGDKCLYPKLMLNEKNIDSIMKILTEFDIGSKKFGRLMNNDLMGSNVRFTEDKAGVLDFELMTNFHLEDEIEKIINNKQIEISPDISDTSQLKSNVRTFEYGTLHQYLKLCPPQIAKDTFKIYLARKSQYHEFMSKYFSNEVLHTKNKAFYQDIANKEKLHSIILSKVDDEIVKAEALKIQLSKFFYQSRNPKYRGHINPEQITDYYNNSLSFFTKNFLENFKHKNLNKAVYYLDCVNFTKNLEDIKYLDTSKIDKKYITNEHIVTLDDIIL